LLVDDIYTSGATARAGSRVLRQGGASWVWVATATRAQPEVVALWNSASKTAVWDGG
jgi:adenine/guanine phosphoribosyltransferase-like PRPP-binding protein